MADPFAFTDPMALSGFNPAVAFAPPQPPKPVAPAAPAPAPAQPRTVASTMLAPAANAPASLTAPVQFPGLPAPAAQPAQSHAPAGSVNQFMQLVRAHESGGNDKASSGVADGRYQFTPQTWAGVAREHPELGLQPQDIWDGAKQDLAMRAISKDYVNVLSLNGLAPSMPNMFMLHFLGTGGGPKFLKEMQGNPNANAAALFPLEAQYNHNDFYEKNGQPRSLQQVYALMTKTFGGPQASMAPIDQGTLKAIDLFDAAAGVPVGARGFSPQAGEVKTSLEEIPGGLKPLPGMTPIKDALKPLPGMTPLNSGLKLDYNSKDPLKPAGAYTDKDGVYHPAEPAQKDEQIVKPGHGLTDVAGYDPAPPGAMGVVGDPEFTDPKGQQEYDKAAQEVDKGVAAGAAQSVTGPASLLPNFLGGGYAERANEALSAVGDKESRMIGGFIPLALGGLGAAGEIGATGLGAVGRQIAAGAATGALSQSSNPAEIAGKAPAGHGGIGSDAAAAPPWSTTGERWAGKLPDMSIGALIGGSVGAIPGALTGAKWLGGELSDVFGTEVKKAAEDLRTGFDSATGKELSEEARAAKIATIERAAEKRVIADQAERKVAPPDVVGKELQTALIEDRNLAVEKRKIESGFEAAVKSDGGHPSIKTTEAQKEIADIEKRFDVNLSDLKSTLSTEKQPAVSIERGRHFVDVLNDKIEEAKPGPAHALKDVRDKFVDHMEQTHPQLKEARQKYAAESRNVDPYERKGKMAKAAESDLYSKQPIMDSTKVTSLLTDKTAAGGEAIKRLVENDKTGKVQDIIRQHFNHELFGSGGATKTPKVEQMTKLLADRRMALENSGLYKEFEKLRDERAAFEKPADVRKAALDAYHEIATIRSDLKSARNPKQIVSASKKALDMLIRDRRITQSQYEEMLNGVKDVQEHIDDHTRAKKFALVMGGILASAIGGEEVARYVGHRYNPR